MTWAHWLAVAVGLALLVWLAVIAYGLYLSTHVDEAKKENDHGNW